MKFFKKRTDDYGYEDDASFYDDEYYGASAQKEGNGFDDDDASAESEKTSGSAFAGTSSPVALKVMKPQSYEDGPEIADYLANGSTVLLNIEEMDKVATKRLLDFLLGATHVLGGTMNMVAKGTFVFAPKNVGVADLTASGAADAGEISENVPVEE